MNIDLFRHWIPDLRQTSKHVFVGKQCPFCERTPKSKSFRVNLKIKVFKCFQCGRSGKSFDKFIHYLKGRDTQRKNVRHLKRMGRHSISIDVYYGCKTLKEVALPF